MIGLEQRGNAFDSVNKTFLGYGRNGLENVRPFKVVQTQREISVEFISGEATVIPNLGQKLLVNFERSVVVEDINNPRRVTIDRIDGKPTKRQVAQYFSDSGLTQD